MQITIIHTQEVAYGFSIGTESGDLNDLFERRNSCYFMLFHRFLYFRANRTCQSG